MGQARRDAREAGERAQSAVAGDRLQVNRLGTHKRMQRVPRTCRDDVGDTQLRVLEEDEVIGLDGQREMNDAKVIAGQVDDANGNSLHACIVPCLPVCKHEFEHLRTRRLRFGQGFSYLPFLGGGLRRTPEPTSCLHVVYLLNGTTSLLPFIRSGP